MAKTDFKSVDGYLAAQPDAVRAILQRVQQGHDPVPPLGAGSRPADPAHREAARARSGGKGESEGHEGHEGHEAGTLAPARRIRG
jgi:hypothetical protein